MRRNTVRACLTYAMIAGLLVLPFGSTAALAAKRPGKHVHGSKSVTDLRFKLDSHDVLLGEEVTGTVRARSKTKGVRTPLAGATLAVYVGKVLVDEVTTDFLGRAEITYAPEATGSYNIKVVYSGSASNKAARRAQGFEVLAQFFADQDGDGFGDPDSSVEAEEQPEGYVEDDSDCDDADAAVNPAAEEIVDNAADDDCDGDVDESDEIDEGDFDHGTDV